MTLHFFFSSSDPIFTT